MRSNPANPSLENRLRLEGWSLHQRLNRAMAHGVTSGSEAHAHDVLQGWRQVVAPDHAANLEKRLAWDGLTPDAAAWALQPDATSCPQDPSWWPLLEALRQAPRNGLDPGGLTERCNCEPFVHVWRPVASWALQILQHRSTVLEPQLHLSADTWLDLGEALLERLCSTADQALWDLFNQRRTPGQMLLAHLGDSGDGSGEPVHEAYDAFVAELLGSGYALLLNNFPVLGRLLATITQLWLEGSEEILNRVAASRAELQRHFAIPADAVLRRVQLGLSDPHRGGRTVAILSFGDAAPDDVGNDLRKVVYKPKDMQVDQVYQDFLRGLNDASTLPPLRCLRVLSCDGYGFMEWVEHRTCDSEEELTSFYINAGRTMAVLHLLGCTDCHYENLIASGDQLLLIDTETLLEADLRDLISDDGDDPHLLSSLQTSMQGSVLRSGLLPQWQMAGAGKKRAFDISALGVQPPPAEREMPGWLGLNSDGMMAGRSIQRCELPTSLPVALGQRQRLTDFSDQLCNGFDLQLQEAMRLRKSLQQALLQFSGKPRRLVARATRLYYTIQRQMLEPASLRSAVAHGLKLEQLSRSYVLASEMPRNWPMFKAELLQMERLDIPFFEQMIDGEDLPLPEGLTPIQRFTKASGLTAARQRLELLDQGEIKFQQQLIRGSIAARHLKTSSSTAGRAPAVHIAVAAGSAVDADVYRQEALRLAEELWNDAIRDNKGRPEWLGMDLGADGESFHFGLIGHSLYSGVSGIALLFARLAQASSDEAAVLWRGRAWCCLEALAELAERNSNEQLFRLVRDLPYGISGTGGILLALHLLGDAEVEGAGILGAHLINQLRPERLLADEGMDLIGGVAGMIAPLLLVGTTRAQELAAICGERLLSLQLESGGWPNGAVSSQSKPPLTGFSHGAAGMAAALARLSTATGDVRFSQGADRAIAYERSVFVAECGNWPDFRNTNNADAFMLSWCHGAPGILLSRHAIKEAGMADAACETEMEVARASTLAVLTDNRTTRADAPAHLCCGVLGLTSLLRFDALARGVSLEPAVPKAESTLIAHARTGADYTFLSIDSGSLNLPGLFTGKAGAALSLLEASEGTRWLPMILSSGLLSNHI
jgi:type 2 lantibiotic biosynthesis protein LanM